MSSIFSKIVTGEIPCHKIYEDAHYLAFLDIMPLVTGHTLVIPKIEVDYIFDLDDKILNGLLGFAKPIAKAVQKVIPCHRVGIAVIGLEVPHAHMHLIPLQSVEDINFTRPKMHPSQSELAEVAAKIRAVYI